LIPVGSTTFRSAILETQPILSLHGHIHDTKNAAKLKRTVCVDPGSEYSAGTLRGAIVNLERDRVLSYQFTTGSALDSARIRGGILDGRDLLVLEVQVNP